MVVVAAAAVVAVALMCGGAAELLEVEPSAGGGAEEHDAETLGSSAPDNTHAGNTGSHRCRVAAGPPLSGREASPRRCAPR